MELPNFYRTISLAHSEEYVPVIRYDTRVQGCSKVWDFNLYDAQQRVYIIRATQFDADHSTTEIYRRGEDNPVAIAEGEHVRLAQWLCVRAEEGFLSKDPRFSYYGSWKEAV
jgi:hypothetical protein